MRKASIRSIAVAVAVAGGVFGMGAGASVGIGEAGAAQHALDASKAAFCHADIAIDRASANATSAADFIAVLKAHQQDLTTMAKNAPSGSLGRLAKKLVATAQNAVATNNPSPLATVQGGPVDSYCGVDGRGRPLPSYFNTGKGTAYCTNFLPIYRGVGAATTNADVLSAFTDHKAQVRQLAADAPKVAASVRSAAATMAAKSKAIVASPNITSVEALASSAGKLALYCGQNQ
jgi:hypothetical protein